jgi:hypothetical protein
MAVWLYDCSGPSHLFVDDSKQSLARRALRFRFGLRWRERDLDVRLKTDPEQYQWAFGGLALARRV